MTLSTMLFSDEIIPVAELAEQLPDMQPTEKELAMAKLLIESQLTEFQPEKYKNEYHAAVMALIDSKAEQEAIITKPAAQAAPVIDIMAAIEASLAAIKKDKSNPKQKRKTRHNPIYAPANCGRLLSFITALQRRTSVLKWLCKTYVLIEVVIMNKKIYIGVTADMTQKAE